METNNYEKRKERFKTVAAKRVQKVLDGMDNLSKCANKRNYEYSEEEIRKMFKVINEKVAMLKAAYTSNSKTDKESFEF